MNYFACNVYPAAIVLALAALSALADGPKKAPPKPKAGKGYLSRNEAIAAISNKLSSLKFTNEIALHKAYDHGIISRGEAMALEALSKNSRTQSLYGKVVDQNGQPMLRDGSSVKETAAQLGYKYPHHFSRAFKKQHGFCPRNLGLCVL